MKTNKQTIYTLIIVATSLFACKKNDGPSVDDYFLNYEIKEIPVTSDYTVGAFYYSWGTFNANIKEVPTVGKYQSPNGNIPADIMKKHIDTASTGGLDYFVFQVRSVSRDLNNFRFDSLMVKRFIDANTDNKMKFAVAYNFSTGSYSLSATNMLDTSAVRLDQWCKDIEKFASWFQNANYMKVNGKTLLYIMNAHQLFTIDAKVVYNTLRTRLSAMGFELYIGGMQDRWTPPARYIFRYKGGVDAIFHQSYVSNLNQYDRFYLLPQMMDQNWQYSRKYFKDSANVDYIPTISPAYNGTITNPANTNPVVGRADNGEMYKKLCNVAKMNASEATRLILIDSWNKWDEDLQLEPALSYGKKYLELTKSQFKK
ncbi:MAG: glycoside hydrolase family 99-like domain-containing protein [Niastella sp.]|nr:glycoside hydrolase family 99-like domain-containing protein [Niastella sp.]